MATITDFGTESGTVRVASVTPTAAEYTGALTLGTVTYGLIKYTFSAVDLSPVIVGDALTVAGFTNAENNAAGLIVTAISNVDNTLTVRSTVRTDANKDETGISGTGSVLATAAAIQKPSDNWIKQGFKAPQKPSAEFWNWVITEIIGAATSLVSHDTIAEWEAVNHAAGNDGAYAIVSGYGLYKYDASSALIADGETVLEDSNGVGRGILEIAHPDAIFAYAQALYGDPVYTLDTSITYDFGSISAHSALTTTGTLLGLRSGADIQVTTPSGLNTGLIATGHFDSNDTFELRLNNFTAGALNPGELTFRIIARL